LRLCTSAARSPRSTVEFCHPAACSSERDTTSLGAAFHLAENGSSRPGQILTNSCQVRRPRQHAAVRDRVQQEHRERRLGRDPRHPRDRHMRTPGAIHELEIHEDRLPVPAEPRRHLRGAHRSTTPNRAACPLPASPALQAAAERTPPARPESPTPRRPLLACRTAKGTWRVDPAQLRHAVFWPP
jgi:hypothetical protein